MAVVIPNSTDTTGGEEYASLDQAEPDSLDFEIVGNAGSCGVLDGCEVTSNGSSTNVAVSAGNVVIQGASYAVASSSTLTLPTAPTDTRFDLVIARVSGGTASLTVLQGVESAGNPVYPQSLSVFGGSFDASIHVDFATDVVLAAVLREASGAVTSSRIVDKRAMVHSTVYFQGTALPGSAPDGTLFFKTNEGTAAGATRSGLYIRLAGSWAPISQSNTYSTIPVGMSMTWRGENAIPDGFLVENGSDVSRTTYADLFAEIGTRYGSGDGSTTFTLPDRLGRVDRGISNVSDLGNTGGSDTVSLTSGQIPGHTHSMSHSHTNSHTHSISHNHASATSSSSGVHMHETRSRGTNPSGLPYTPQPVVWYPNGTSSGGTSNTWNYGSYGGTAHEDDLVTDNSSSHTHTVNLPNYSGTSGGSSSSTTSTFTGNTGSTGSGNAVTVTNPYLEGIPVIKAL